MTVQTLRRSILFTALVLTAQLALAGYPPSLTGVRMAFDESTGYAVMFGGATAVDLGTGRSYFPIQTWTWSGSRWVLRYPADNPSGRAAHAMTYDSARNRVVLFGGRSESADLGDTWIYTANNWTHLDTPNAPSTRSTAGMAYDRIRDRIVLFGGVSVTTDGKTATDLYDTWEFDGTTWTKVQDAGPLVRKPQLAFDETRNQTVLVGIDANVATVMYTWDPAARSWSEVKPQTLPPCANESAIAYQRASGTIVLVGGVCATSTVQSGVTEETYVWDGTNWAKLETKTAITRATDMAIAYDPEHDATVIFGGTIAFGLPRSSTYMLSGEDWTIATSNAPLPGPRSLFALTTDPVNKVLWASGGISDVGYYPDFWRSVNGGWEQITADAAPQCMSPRAAFDTDRSKLVVACQTGDVYEWDGTTWKGFTELKTKPVQVRFASLVYDQSQKRTVLFGGYDESNYADETWLWDGATWSEQKNHRAPARALTSMWFDPILKKTVIFGGIGRRDPQGRLERYNDMWVLDSNGWTQLKPATLPGTRYGAQIAVDPRVNKVFLFGGLRLDIDDKGLQRQVYANDMWQWDGTTWTKVTINGTTPPPRENGAMAFDPSRNRIVLFGGWSGYYLSDRWLFDSSTSSWTPEVEYTGRRRVTGGH